VTIEPIPTQPSYPVSGTGPYAVMIPFAELGDIDLQQVLPNGALVPVDAALWTLAAIGSALTGYTGGSITLTAPAATELAGRIILPVRRTTVEQGWAGVAAREKGLEAQLDRTAMALQEAQGGVDRAVRTLRPIQPFDAQPGKVLAFDANGHPSNGPDVGDIASAAQFAQESLAARDLARRWATDPQGAPIETGPDRFSALHHSNIASQKAADADAAKLQAQSAADAANAALLNIGVALLQDLGAFTVNADGDLIATYAGNVIQNIEINANGELLMTYEVTP
jgi:hypothetical protein